MGVINRDGALFMATGIDNSGLEKDARDAARIIEEVGSESEKTGNRMSKSFESMEATIISTRMTISALEKTILSLNEKLEKKPLEAKKIQELEASLEDLKQKYEKVSQSAIDNRNEIQSASQEAKQAASDYDSLTNSLKNAWQALGIGVSVAGIKSFVSEIVNVRSEFQNTEAMFKVFLGSAEKAKSFMKEMEGYAFNNVFEFKDLTQQAAQLLAFKTEANDVVGVIDKLSNVAAGVNKPLEQFVELYNKAKSRSKLDATDVQQWSAMGDVIGYLAEMLGKSTSEVQVMVSEGKIGFKEMDQLLTNLTSTGGRFHGMMEEKMKTLGDSVGLLQDSITSMFNQLGESSEDFLRGGILLANDLVENYETIGEVILTLIATYGTYKAALVVISALEKANTAILRQAVLEKNLAAAANVKLTSTEAYQAASKELLTFHTTTLTKALRAQAVAMATNPAILFTGAIVGAGYAIYKLATHSTEAEKALSRLTDAAGEAEKASLSETRELAKLKGELSALQKGTDEYNQVKNKIIANYGKYYTGLELEIEKVGLLESTYDSLTEAIKRSFGARQYDSFIKSEQDNLDNIMSDSLGKIQEKLIEKLGDEAGAKYYSKIRKAIMEGSVSIERYNGAAMKAVGLDDETLKALDKISGNASGDWIRDYGIEGLIKGITEAEKQFEVLDEKAKNKFGIDDSSTSQDEDPVIFKFVGKPEQIKEAQEAVSSLRKELENLNSINPEGFGEKEQFDFAKGIEEKTKALKEAENKLSILLYGKSTTDASKGESSADKARKQAEDFRKAQERQAQYLIRSAEDLEMQIAEAEIRGMDEGSKKVLAQLELNYKKEKLALERQQDETLKAKVDNARAVFDATSKKGSKAFDESSIELSAEETKKFQDLQLASTLDYEKAKYNLEIQHMRDYIKEYGTFQQRKLALAQEYDQKIAASGSTAEKKILENQKRSSISSIDVEAIYQNIDWQAVFGNMSGMLESQLKDTLDSLKKYILTDEFSLSPETDKKVIYEAIDKIKEIMSGGEGTLNFRDLKSQMDNLGQAVNTLQTATVNEEAALSNLSKARKQYEGVLKSGDQNIIASAKLALDTAQASADAASAAYQDAEDNVNKLGQGFKETAGDTIDGLNLVGDGLHGFASNSLPEIFSALQKTVAGLSKLNIGGEVGDAVGKLSSTISNAGFIGQIISAILSILDVLKDGIGTLVSNLIDTVLNAVDGILKNLLSGEMFVLIFNSLKTGIGNILNTISFGGFNSLMSSINGSNAKETAETISRLTISNEALKVSVDALKDEMAGANGIKSLEAYSEAVNAQKRYNENLRQILNANMGYHNAHKSNSYYWNLDPNSLREVNKQLGTTLNNSWNDFSSLTADQMNEIRKHLPDVWSEMINQGKYGDRFKDDWNNYADQAGKVVDLTDALRENIAQISFQSLRDSFVDALMDMDSDAKDFAGNFEEYLTKALLNFAIGDMLDEDLKKWYESWTDSMNNQAGKLTEEQIEQYKKQWDDMVQDGLNKRDEIADLTGYTGKGDSSSQQASKGYSVSMSQDTGDKVVGILTSCQMIWLGLDSKLGLMQANSSEVLLVIRNYNTIFMEMRNIALQSMSYLEDISTYTKKYLPTMANDLSEVKRNTSDL